MNLNNVTTIDMDRVTCWVIDLDETLYTHEAGVWDMIRKRIDRFLRDEMRFPEAEVDRLRARLFKQYGTTLRGLQVEYQVDMAAYLRYVHDIPLEAVLKPNPALSEMLASLPQRKVIFTNADEDHAVRVLTLLGVRDHFDLIVDIYDSAPHCKPELAAFQKALALIGEAPEACLLVDDSPPNLATARSLGMQTVSVGQRHHDGSPHIVRIEALGELINT